MNTEYIIGIIVSVALSANGFMIRLFISNIRELKKAIQDLSLAIKSSQKDIEFLNKTVELHERILDRHAEDIEELKHNKASRQNRKKS